MRGDTSTSRIMWKSLVLGAAIAFSARGDTALDNPDRQPRRQNAVTQSSVQPFEISEGGSATRNVPKSLLAFWDSTADRRPSVTTDGREPLATQDYEIGAGDVLQISVWKEPEASVAAVVVRPDGRISLPLAKEVAVSGLTLRQTETVIATRLAEFIHGVDVTVIVTAINSKKIYMIGGVKKEGPLAYTYRMTVLQAIAEAGGLTEYAKRKKIYVLHAENGQEYRLPFDYDEVVKGKKTDQNIQLSAGDTVFVPH
jgi:polysaccharide biosynthesis/export protein